MTSVDIDSRPETPITTRTLRRERVKVSQHVAAAIAHELRNPVFSIASAAQLLRYRTTDDPMTERNVGRILREAERLNALVSALLEYGRPAPVRLEPADPDDVWTDVLEANRGVLESKALLVQHRAATPRATCAIDAEQLAQALANALLNAVHAAPEGTDLTITSTIDGAAGWRSRLHNDGAAIPAEILPRAFEPLVSSKPGHAGIGLAVAQRIVHEHGGSVALDSIEGAGTTFTMSLPLARP
jgi:signal transduction histidine kinase